MRMVSVVVLNWNGVHLLPGCLDSVRAQTFRDFEIIMPDNGSTDGSLELVAARYPEVRTLSFRGNLGFCLAMNAAIRASRGEFIVVLNNDTELDPRCLEALVGEMQTHERVGICAPKMIYHEDAGLINSAGHACGPDGVVVDIGRGERDSEWFSRRREVLGACAGAALYRRRMLEEIGLFDPDFFISFEDADLDWRAQWAGWRARYVPTAVVRHQEGISRGIRSRRATFLGMRNTVHVWAKNWPLASLLRHLPGIWRGWRSSALALTRRGDGELLPLVGWGVLAQMPRMLSRRRDIRQRRVVNRARFEELLALGDRQTRQPPED